ncbi:unnamed protein product [Prorocentrum cordatum]|uniref:RZ-type domain-containing protein n=1 Tax=Prorocentrum cordatum TaxID=2364126 RepID=A0ABN9Q6G1_9DINO|nr:unnamed protein product [Polarella glacialis]
MALFKTIIIDRVYGNKVIPPRIRIISCCNPYRIRKTNELEQVALVFQHQATNNTTAVLDPMKSLVYRVHPLPESLIDVVSDFGALSERSEELYINSIIRKELRRVDQLNPADAQEPNEFDTFLDAFRDLLCQSQSFVREVNGGERSVVSMRDIARAARVFKWFLTQYSGLRGVENIAVTIDDDGVMSLPLTPDTKPHLRNAVILTLGYCYHARLNRDERWVYRKRICTTWKKMLTDRPSVQWLNLENANDLDSMLIETQLQFVSEMDLGEGIALNEALRENLFMLLVSIMNQIPILLIGKPGCSKSLAMGVLQQNLIGEVSNKKIFKTMPSVDVFAYQCSPLSTPEAILSAFRSARQSNLKHESNIVCVLLDEVGLAEESPHLPLKVLHRELEDLQGIACVGISNWALDAAKMSRCVTLYRPPPTIEDLCVTAEGMVASANLKAYLKPLSTAFHMMYKNQSPTRGAGDFWGMREFYSTVRVINMELKKRASEGLEAVLEPQVLMKTVQRNFGGQSASDLDQCVEEFFERCSMDENGSGVKRYTIPELIQQNLKEPDARHLMLLTKNNAALRLLFESNLIDHSTAKVMFGSTFSSDQSDIFVAMNLQKIKGFMQQPISLVLVHCDSLYESLYDLLNQHYMEFAGQRYVRIAHGSKAKQCPIHRLFRVIVVTEMYDAYYRLPPPLLNRFEKQVFLRKDLMTKADEALLAKLTRFWNMLLGVVNDWTHRDKPDGDITMGPKRASLASEAEHDQDGEGPRHRPVVGYHPEMLNSLVVTLRRRFGSDKSIDQLFALAKELLMWVMTPEAVCIVASRCDGPQLEMKFGVDLVSEYFHKQRHSDLPSFTEDLIQNRSNWCDDLGAQVMITTFSPIRGYVKGDLEHFVSDGGSITEVSLHEFSSSQDIDKAVNSFYVGAAGQAEGGKRFLLIHADPAAASLRVIEHARFVCETERAGAHAKLTESGAAGSMFVLLIVHLQRGTDAKFSFDFDSQWHFAFLDSVEPSVDLNSMPLLGDMLQMPLIQVVQGLNFEKLLQTCFRASLSRLIYPKSRKPEDLHQQIQLILSFLADAEFVKLVRDWVLCILETTPKNSQNEEEGSFGADTTWFAAIAMAAHELAMAGTFRAALHNRVAVLVGSLLTVLLAHLDRNQGLALLQEPPKRTLWLNIQLPPARWRMCRASLTSNLSLQLKHQAVQALSEDASAQHEVGTDAQTGAKPFVSRFPASWFASKSIDGERHMMESLPPEKQLAALEEQYKISMLQEVGLDPVLPSELLDDYLHDFTAMHVDWTARIDRSTQTRILSKTLTRFMNQVSPVQRQVTSILEVHQAFWRQEKQVDYFIKLLNAVPDAVPQAERLIETSDLSTLILNMLLLVHETLSNELLQVDESLFTLAWVEERARVLDRDLRQLSKEELQSMGRSLFYREWLQRKMVVANLSRDYMSSVEGARDSALLRELKTDKEPRLETLSLMFQQVACALKLPLEVVKKFLKHLPEGKIRHPRSLLAILTLAQDVAGCPQGLEACGAFCESWLLDVCLRDAETISDMDETALRLICGLAAGLPVVVEKNSVVGVTSGKISDWSETAESGIAALPGTGGVIPRSSCLNLALLRKLLVTSRHDARQIAVRTIEELLLEVSRREGHNDTTFATRYTVLMEEDFESKMKDACEPHNWPDISLQAVFSPDRSRSPATMLEEVGKIRWMLQRYADVLCQDSVNHAAHDACAEKVDGLLQTDDEQLEKVCRSLRMFLLKCIERRKGVSFLRALLDARPLSDTGWVTKWRTNHDIEFEKFIGAALVPKWNPFTGQDGSPEYNEAKAAIFEMMSSTSTAKLDQFAKSIASKEGIQQKRSIGGFLLAVCQELGLHSALETADRPPQWRGPLNEWLATTKALPVTDQERMLLRIFAGDASAIAQLPEDDGAPLGPFVVSGGRKMDDLLKFRLLGHIASVCISAPSSSLLASLREIMLRPKSLMPDMFLPSMDEDIRNRVMKALLERGENIWKFKSHWYSCVCGYSFFIGECGRPMEVATCPQCAKPIGGRDHNPTTNSLVDEEKDRSPHGYMLPVADKDEKHISFREIPASSTRAVRLLLHGCMFCGIAGHVDVHEHRVPRIYENIVNRDTMCTMYEGGHKEGMYIADHFAHDLEQMTAIMSSNPECLVMAMHALLTRMSVQLKDVPKGKTGAAGQVASGSADEVNWEKLDLPSRNAWEETIEATYLNEMVKNYDTSTQEFHARWGAGAAEDGKFVAELMEAADVQGFPTKKRDQELPQLWAFRSPVTLGALHQRIGMQSDGKNDLPVLTTVLQQQVWKVMRALRCLVGVFDWHALVMSAFSGRITRAQAQDLRVGDVLEGQAPSEREKWERAFEDLQKAWSIAWSSVERYECQEIPQHMKSVSLTRNSAMVYCIADPQNEGICPLALTQFLVERHNELVQVVSSANGYPVKKVSTRLLAQHDVVNYNGSQLMKFLKSRCVTYGVGGKLNFAFKQLEQKLRRELSRPELTMEVRGFNWLGESFAIGSQLRTVLPQRDLAADVVARIREEVTSPSVASQMVQEVQITISFILKSGVAFGKNAGNTFLAEYFKSVCLQNSVQCLPSNTARAEVQLRHLDSFIKLLKQIMNKDPMENVDDKYKEPLPEEMKKALLAAKPNLPAILIQVLATFAEARLVETSLKDSEGMLEILEHAQDEFADAGTHAFRAVQQHFPQKLQMKHWVAVYNTLKQPNGKPLDTDVL